MLSACDLNALFDYDPASGDLKWRHRDPRYFSSRITAAMWNTKFAGKIAGTPHNSGYEAITIFNKRYLKHRIIYAIIFGEWPSAYVDHVNGDKLDNRACNIRAANGSQSIANIGKRSHNTSGLKGVSWRKQSRKWRASICYAGKQITLGDYDCRAAAFLAYIVAADKLHGEFARVF